jgi:DNA-binding GntR family transcriptional regulator
MILTEQKTIKSKPTGLGVQIAEMLKQAILEGDFKGGDQLGEHDLQVRFGVSRSPLREAFRELEKLGLVEIIPRKGSFVRRISRKDIEENFPVRAALEGLAAELAAKNMTKNTLDRLEDILEEMKKATRDEDIRRYYTYHLQFHEIFIERAENELLINTLGRFRMQSLWHRFSYQYYQEDLEKSFQVHQDILDSFKDPKMDPEKIRILVEYHINEALNSFLVYLEDFERK